MPAVTAASVSFGLVWPETTAQLAPSVVETSQCVTDGVGTPVAELSKLAGCPRTTLASWGWAVMVGASSTVSFAWKEVAVPAAFASTARYS